MKASHVVGDKIKVVSSKCPSDPEPTVHWIFPDISLKEHAGLFKNVEIDIFMHFIIDTTFVLLNICLLIK